MKIQLKINEYSIAKLVAFKRKKETLISDKKWNHLPKLRLQIYQQQWCQHLGTEQEVWHSHDQANLRRAKLESPLHPEILIFDFKLVSKIPMIQDGSYDV